MSSNLVIAAIPDENDRVWKVSSEKIPHLTVLFLGDADKVSNLEQIMLFVEHAANTTLKRFYLPVDRRGELGEDKADVLFFKKGRYDFKAIRDFRSMLLKDDNIKTAYDSATQFDGPWNPHLTLGYPETPAKKVSDDQIASFYDVQFNKIAVWTGDFEGPDWLLKDYWDEMEELDCVPMDVAMSAIKHHGVKGQKWGVRKVEGGGPNAHIRINQKTGRAAVSTQATTAIVVPALIMPVLTPVAFLSKRVRAEVKAARAVNKGINADKKWQKELTTSKRAVEVHNTASIEINKKIPDFNNDKRWKGVDLTKDAAKQKEYDTAVERELLNPEYAKAAVKVHGSSPTGRYKFEIKDPSTALLKLTDTTKVEHAADDELSVQFKILRDANGHILGFTAEDNEEAMAQTADLTVEFLEHHGIKGMKWGVRKSANTPASIDIGNKVTFGPGVAAQRIKSGFIRVGSAVSKWHAQLADSNWQSSIYRDIGHENVHNHVAENIDHHVDKLARSPKYREKNLRTDRDLQREYYQDVARVTDSAYRKAVKDVYGENYTGTKKARYIQDPRGPRIEIRDKKTGDLDASTPLSSMRDIKERRAKAENDAFVERTLGEKAVHAATAVDVPDISIDLKLNDLGQISGVTFVNLSDTPEESMAQTADIGAEWLAHHGVKGMKWGHRKERGTPGFFETKRAQSEREARVKRTPITPRTIDTIGSSGRKKTTISVKGGQDHPATPDALRVAGAQQKLKKSGVHALSNKELQEVATRLNLEVQVKNLTKGNQSMSQKFIDGLLGRGSKEDRKGFENKAGQSVASTVGKKLWPSVA
jgi:2'-5' RNA ligase